MPGRLVSGIAAIRLALTEVTAKFYEARAKYVPNYCSKALICTTSSRASNLSPEALTSTIGATNQLQ